MMRPRRGCWRLLAGAVTLSAGGALALGVAPAADAQAGTAISLTGVSCTGAAACEATGSYTNSSGVGETLAEVWNGTKWAIQKTPNPSGSTAADLANVLCTGVAACEATGFYTNSSGVNVTLAEVWNGTKWAIQKTPNPSGSTSSVLSGLSCTGVSACEATGSYTNSSRVGETLAEVWNGTKWAIQATPNPSGSTENLLSGVSCTSAAACEAVGSSTNSSGDDVTLAEVWNGTKWAIQATPNPSGSTVALLGGVWCTGAAACEAAGSSFGSGAHQTLAEAWNGTKWAIQKTPNPSGTVYKSIGRVSCTGAAACESVGFYTNSSDVNVTLAEAWNGTRWAIQKTPNPSGSTETLLSGVSCANETACEAVGFYSSSGVQKALAEVWNGTKWAIQVIPNP